MLTENWVNGISAVIVAGSLVRAWLATDQPAAAAPAAPTTEETGLFVSAHLLPRHMHHNRAEITGGEWCGCVHCEQVFRPAEIRRWVEAGRTAVCPRCGADTVVGSGAGFRLTPQLLHRVHMLRERDAPVRQTH